MTSASRIDLQVLKEFLAERGWTNLGGPKTFESFRPPADLGLPEKYTFSLPKVIKLEADASLVESAIGSIAELYDLRREELRVLLFDSRRHRFQGRKGSPQILSVGFGGDEVADGSIALRTFEPFIVELKRLLLDTASFCILDAPKFEVRPSEADYFFESCRFMQTEIGSFITRIEIPNIVIQQTGFDRDEVDSAQISQRLFRLLTFVTNTVLPGNSGVFEESFLFDHAQFVSFEVLRDIQAVMTKSEAHELNFGLKTARESSAIATGFLDDIKLKNLARFVDFVRDAVSDEINVDTSGVVVELKSKDPNEDRNYVLIRRSNDHSQDIGLYLNSANYSRAVLAHQSGRHVKVKGKARQLKTKIKITTLEEFEIAGSSGEST